MALECKRFSVKSFHCFNLPFNNNNKKRYRLKIYSITFLHIFSHVFVYVFTCVSPCPSHRMFVFCFFFNHCLTVPEVCERQLQSAAQTVTFDTNTVTHQDRGSKSRRSHTHTLSQTDWTRTPVHQSLTTVLMPLHPLFTSVHFRNHSNCCPTPPSDAPPPPSVCVYGFSVVEE